MFLPSFAFGIKSVLGPIWFWTDTKENMDGPAFETCAFQASHLCRPHLRPIGQRSSQRQWTAQQINQISAGVSARSLGRLYVWSWQRRFLTKVLFAGVLSWSGDMRQQEPFGARNPPPASGSGCWTCEKGPPGGEESVAGGSTGFEWR